MATDRSLIGVDLRELGGFGALAGPSARQRFLLHTGPAR